MTLPFSYSPDGSCIVSSDGPELLVYDGPSEGPLWRTTQGSDIVAVGATVGEVAEILTSAPEPGTSA